MQEPAIKANALRTLRGPLFLVLSQRRYYSTLPLPLFS